MPWKERFRHARLGRASSAVLPNEIVRFLSNSEKARRLFFDLSFTYGVLPRTLQIPTNERRFGKRRFLPFVLQILVA